MTYRFVVDAPTHWATRLVTNLGKKKLWNHTRFISTGSTSLHGGVPYTTLCKWFCLHFGFKLNFNSCLGFLYHFSFAGHSVYALSIHSLFHLPLVSVCSMCWVMVGKVVCFRDCNNAYLYLCWFLFFLNEFLNWFKLHSMFYVNIPYLTGEKYWIKWR